MGRVFIEDIGLWQFTCRTNRASQGHDRWSYFLTQPRNPQILKQNLIYFDSHKKRGNSRAHRASKGEEKVRRKEEILSLYEINSVVISSDGSYFIEIHSVDFEK